MEILSNQMAGWITKQGMKQGDTMALVMQNRPEFICWWLGMAKLGIKVAMINYNIKAAGLVHCIKVANCTAVIFDEDTLEVIQSSWDEIKALPAKLVFYQGTRAPEGCVTINHDQLLSFPPTPPPASINAETGLLSTFGYIYTSGTTG